MKTKEITLVSHRGHRKFSEEATGAESAGEPLHSSHDSFWLIVIGLESSKSFLNQSENEVEPLFSVIHANLSNI